MQLPLEDIKVLDLSHALAGPFCSTMFADFGAQVSSSNRRARAIARSGAPMPGGDHYF
jgi:formyl-CoA transferase/CoA:oxalate CoA-transferase